MLGLLLYKAKKINSNLFLWKNEDGFIISIRENVDLVLHNYNKYYKINDDDIIIDVGAHIGLYTLKASKRVKKGIVIAIEPSPNNYKLLNLNVKLNKLKNVITLNVALGDFVGRASLFLTKTTVGDFISKLHPNKKISRQIYGLVPVQVEKLDNIVQNLGLKKVNFVKIDAEGAELSILKGSIKTILTMKPSFAICCEHYKNEIDEIERFLVSYDYLIIKDGNMVFAIKN